jgi:translation initiation factor IF-2
MEDKAKMLFKVAKELNVGTTTVVEYLSKKGFDIENKPTAKINDTMYSELVKQFSGDMAIKEKADQLVIGSRPTPTIEKKPVLPPVKSGGSILGLKKEVPQETVKEPEPQRVEEPKIAESKETNDVVTPPKVILQGPKVLGKIDLEVKKPAVNTQKPAPQKPPQQKPPQPKVVPQPENKVIPTPKSEPTEKSTPEFIPPEMIRAETPTLKGLKILGKIDTDKFADPSKKKGKPDAAQAAKDAADKKKRKRKIIPAQQSGGAGQNQGGNNQNRPNPNYQGNNPNNGQNQGGTNQNRPNPNYQGNNPNRPSPNYQGNRPNNQGSRPGQGGGGGGTGPRPHNNTPNEVSKKEIEDKLKATMARLNMGAGKGKGKKLRRDSRDLKREKQEQRDQEGLSSKLQVTEFITVSELASVLNISVGQVITTCLNLGVIVSINQRLDAEIIEIIANEFGQDVEFISAEDESDDSFVIEDSEEDLIPRAPIVTVMGHVDHGKTSLLDYIRKATVASGEAGGITQHIGAYEVLVNNKKITFLDTPGHEAFTAMRARGAKVTDVVVIVIAADDNIMPQTKEAMSHATAAGVPMIFAINKIDKDGADPERIKNELAQMNILVESWGGKFQDQEISAKKGTGIEQLLEKVLLEAEILELKANPNRNAVGTIVEASLDKGRGYVAKVLVQTGTLKIGDAMVAGEYSGKVKAMFNERGKKLKEAGPSTPVLILGLGGAPTAGEKFKVTDSEQDARQLAGRRGQINREQSNRASKRISLDEIGRRLALGNFKELNLIVKGDVDGSVEALADSLIKLSMEKIGINVIHKAVGAITESDILLASASDAIVVGFQVRPSSAARLLAEKEGVQIKTYSIIYEAIDEIKMAMEGLLDPTKEEKILGQVEVREVFKISKIGTVAGCYVTEGKIVRDNYIRVIRDGIVVFPTKEGANGEIESLKRFKEDVKEVKLNFECGVTIKNYNDVKEGDFLEVYEIIEVKTKLN